jgi:hypothetical protein
MKERLVTLACALGALTLCLALFVRSEGGSTGKAVPRPTTQEQGGNGYYAAMRWLTGEGLRTISLRERLDRLPGAAGLPSSGNLLIVTLPAAVAFRTSELRALTRWVETGNTLLVLAALADEPDWAFATGSRPEGDVGLLTGLEVVPLAPATRASGGAQPHRGTLIPNRPDASLVGVNEAVALSDYPSRPWRVKVPHDGFVLALASQKETGEGILWTRTLDRGRVIVSGFGSLFAARALGLADNGRLLANIVSTTLGPKGAVLFDDLHQGLGEAYDPARFYSDPRLYQTLGIIAAVWLSWVLGATRLRAPVAHARLPSEADLVRALGGLLARVLCPQAAAAGLLEHFLRRGGRQLSDPQSPWERLERHPRVARGDLAQLRQWYHVARAGKRVPLARLHNLIRSIERQMGP